MKKLQKIPCITVKDSSETGLTVVADDGYALQLKKAQDGFWEFQELIQPWRNEHFALRRWINRLCNDGLTRKPTL